MKDKPMTVGEYTIGLLGKQIDLYLQLLEPIEKDIRAKESKTPEEVEWLEKLDEIKQKVKKEREKDEGNNLSGW